MTTRKSAKQVNKQREDGGEAINRTAEVIPIDSGRGNESAEGKTNLPHAEKPEKE